MRHETTLSTCDQFGTRYSISVTSTNIRIDDRLEGFATVDELDAALINVLAQT